MPRNQAESTASVRPGLIEVLVLVTIATACSQIGYVGHPRYGPFVAAADVLCALVFLGWAGRELLVRRRALRTLPWPPAALFAWLAVGALSLGKSVLDPAGGLSPGAVKAGVIELAQIGLYFLAGYMLFHEALDTPEKRRRCMMVLFAAVSVAVIWGLADYITQPDAMEVKAGFGNRNVYSAFLVMVLPLLVGFGMHEGDVRLRAWSLGLCGVGIVTMLGPPHVWLLLLVLCAMIWARGGAWRRALVPALVVFTLVVSFALPRNRDANVLELADLYERGDLYKLEESAGELSPEDLLIVKKRWLEWQPALLMITENLPLGVGAGSFQRSIGEARYYSDVPNVKKSEPDTNNLYLVMGASMGLAGLVCLLALLGFFWRIVSRRTRGPEWERGLWTGLHGAMMGLMAANIFSSLFVRGCSLVWVLVFALIAVSARGAGGEDSHNTPTR